MNLLNKYAISKEDEDVMENVELSEVAAQVNNDNEVADKVSTALNQLREQNEVIRNVAEKEEMTEAAAVGFALARQAAVAPLNLQEAEQTEVVDEAGLESMVSTKGLVALEANERIVLALEGVIIDTLKNIWSKVKEFFNRLGKMISIINTEYKKAYNVLKKVPDEEFNEAVKDLPSTSAIRNYLTANGNLAEIKEFTKQGEVVIDAAGDIWDMFQDEIHMDSEGHYRGMSYTQFDAKFIDKMNRILSKNFSDAKTLDLGKKKFKVTYRDEKFSLEVDTKDKFKGEAKFTKQQLLDALNMGWFFEECYRSYKKYYKDDAVYDLEKTLAQTRYKPIGYQTAVTTVRDLLNSVIRMLDELNELRQDYNNFALSFE